MKLISLNLWGGRVSEPLINFLKENSGKIDIFCFQEVFNECSEDVTLSDKRPHIPDLLEKLKIILKDYVCYFKPVIKDIYGIGMFIKKDLKVLEEGEVIVSKKLNYPKIDEDHTRNFQWAKVKSKEKIYTILNIHGLWTGTGKNDTPDRIKQSEIISKFISSFSGPRVLCGDFNLLPETESVKIIEKNMTNLIKIYNIKSTRSHFYKKEERFADYAFISSEIKVKDFKVLEDPVSDHLPLFLDFK